MKKNNIQEREEIFELTPDMIESIKKGEEDHRAGRVHTNEEVFKEIDDWLNSQ